MESQDGVCVCVTSHPSCWYSESCVWGDISLYNRWRCSEITWYIWWWCKHTHTHTASTILPALNLCLGCMGTLGAPPWRWQSAMGVFGSRPPLTSPPATCSPLHQNHGHQNDEGSISFPCWEMMSSARDVSWGIVADGWHGSEPQRMSVACSSAKENKSNTASATRKYIPACLIFICNSTRRCLCSVNKMLWLFILEPPAHMLQYTLKLCPKIWRVSYHLLCF